MITQNQGFQAKLYILQPEAKRIVIFFTEIISVAITAKFLTQ